MNTRRLKNKHEQTPSCTTFHEEFEIKYANTGRLNTSAIPYMQRLLNDDFANNPEKYNKKKVRRPGYAEYESICCR